MLDLAAKLGNVSEACRQRGITRPQFYEYQKRFETFGLKGLADLNRRASRLDASNMLEVLKRYSSY